MTCKQVWKAIQIIAFALLFLAVIVYGAYSTYLEFDNKIRLNEYLKSGGEK